METAAQWLADFNMSKDLQLVFIVIAVLAGIYLLRQTPGLALLLGALIVGFPLLWLSDRETIINMAQELTDGKAWILFVTLGSLIILVAVIALRNVSKWLALIGISAVGVPTFLATLYFVWISGGGFIVILGAILATIIGFLIFLSRISFDLASLPTPDGQRATIVRLTGRDEQAANSVLPEVIPPLAGYLADCARELRLLQTQRDIMAYLEQRPQLAVGLKQGEIGVNNFDLSRQQKRLLTDTLKEAEIVYED